MARNEVRPHETFSDKTRMGIMPKTFKRVSVVFDVSRDGNLKKTTLGDYDAEKSVILNLTLSTNFMLQTNQRS